MGEIRGFTKIGDLTAVEKQIVSVLFPLIWEKCTYQSIPKTYSGKSDMYIFRVKGGCVKIVTTGDNAIYIVTVCK